MRIYEELYILKPDVTEEEVEASIELIRGIVTSAGGTVDKVDKWGLRRLAYRVAKASEGFYILIQFSTGPETVKEIERRLRVSDNVMKYITVRIDEKLKWLEKRKKIREKRAAKRPPAPPPQAMPAAPAPGAPAPAMPGAPAPAAPAPAAPAPPVPEPDMPPPTE
ncbi:MAG: 30S ribosomal protein S6 [Acidobacteria bacterium]|nr:30S ribosomal protein S6 [Acidobacteriota bacterium]